MGDGIVTITKCESWNISPASARADNVGSLSCLQFTEAQQVKEGKRKAWSAGEKGIHLDYLEACGPALIWFLTRT